MMHGMLHSFPEMLNALQTAAFLICVALGLGFIALLIAVRGERVRRLLEKELRESESRYRAIFETAVDAIVVSNQHGTIQEFSRAAERMTGYSAAEVIGRNMRVLLPEALRRETERHT